MRFRGARFRLASPLAHVVENGHRHARENRGSYLARHQGECESLEYRVEQDHACSHDHRGRGQQHGAEAHSARIHDGFFQRHSLRAPEFDEIHEDD